MTIIPVCILAANAEEEIESFYANAQRETDHATKQDVQITIAKAFPTKKVGNKAEPNIFRKSDLGLRN